MKIAAPPHGETWRVAHMKRMETFSHKPETLKKLSETLKRGFAEGRRVIPPKRPARPYVLAPASSIKPRKQPKLDTPARRAASERMKTNNPMQRPEVATRVHALIKKAYAEGRIKPPSRAVSSAAELQLFACFEKAGLPIVHCGGRQFWIGPCQSGMRRNPDMRHLSERRVILYSSHYWHPDGMEVQFQDYLSQGWSVLNFWEDALRTNANKSLAIVLAAEFLETGSVLNLLPSWAEVRSTPSL